MARIHVRNRVLAQVGGGRFRVALTSATLIANVAIGSLGGYVFWFVLNALTDASRVGIVATTIAISTILANLTSLGLGQAIIYARKAMPEQFVGTTQTALLIVSALAALATGIYIVVAPVVTPAVALYATPGGALTLVAVVCGLALSGIQDAVIFSSSQPGLVLGRALLTTVTRLAGVVLLVPALGPLGALIAFALGSCVALLCGAFGRRPTTNGKARPVTLADLRGLLSYSAGVYVLGLCSMVMINLMPVIAANTLGTAGAAHFYIAWMLSNLLFTIPGATSAAVFIEGSASGLERHVRQGVRVAVGGVVVGGVGIAAVGNLVLGSFGADYAQAALLPLVILLLSGVPMSFYVIGQSVLKTVNRLRSVIGISVAVTVATLGAAAAAAGRFGLMGLATAWLAGQCAGVLVWAFARHAVLDASGRGGTR